MTDSEGKAPIIVLLSKKVGTKATTLITGSWRSLVPVWGCHGRSHDSEGPFNAGLATPRVGHQIAASNGPDSAGGP